MKNILDKSCRGNKKNTFNVRYFFFLENLVVYEIMSKNVVETEGPQMTSQYGSYAFHAG